MLKIIVFPSLVFLSTQMTRALRTCLCINTRKDIAFLFFVALYMSYRYTVMLQIMLKVSLIKQISIESFTLAIYMNNINNKWKFI